MRSLMLVALLGFLGCAEPPPVEAPAPGYIAPSGEVAVTINDTQLTEDMIGAVTRRIPAEQLEQMKASGQYQQLLERIVVGQLLYEKALERKVQDKPEVQRTLAMSQREVLAAELLEVMGDEAVTDEKIAQAYAEARVQFARPQVHARHILVKEQDLALDLMKQLGAGADFATLAAANSVDPGSKDQGGDLGWFEKGRMIRQVGDAAFAATGDELVGPIESRVGFHVLQVLERREVTPLEEVKDQLSQKVRQDAIEAFITELKDSAKIEWTNPADGVKKEETAAGHPDHPGHSDHAPH